MSTQLPTDTEESFDLVNYAKTPGILLSANDISGQIMRSLQLHFSRSLNDVLKIHDETLDKIEIYDSLEKVVSDLIEVGDAFKSLKRMEELFNEQLKALILPYADRIGKLKDEMKESDRTTETESIIEDQEIDEKEAERQYQIEHIKSQEEIDAAEHMAIQLPDIKVKVSKLKETLNFVPKVPLTGPDTAADAAAAPQSNKSPHDANTDHSVDEFVKEKGDFYKTIKVSSHFKEIQLLYQNLGSKNLKHSLLCLSVFPDDSVIKKRALINWWIGENFADSSEGDKFFNDLLSKGFMASVLIKQKPLIKRCSMHPFTRLMLIPLAGSENFIEFDSSGKILVESFSKSKKAFLIKSERGSSQYAIRNSTKIEEIETLFNVNESFIDIQKHWFSKVKNLKVLQLGNWNTSKDHHIEVASTEFLRHLSNMKQLRYLSLQGISRISEIPVSFSNLVNLRILDLKACHDLRQLPNGIGQLKNLIVLDMSECYFIGQMPKEIALLSELEVLKGFLITDPTKGNMCRLADLVNLQKLKKLSIYADGEAVATEDELKHLKKFKALRLLTIAWVGVPGSKPQKKDGLMKFLKRQNNFVPRNSINGSDSSRANYTAPQNYLDLEKLDLLCTPWTELPVWLNRQEPSKLRKLYIRGGKLKNLHNQDSPWTVEILRLKYLAELEMNWGDLKAAFPKMNYLEKVNCPKLNFFPCDHTGAWMRTSNSSAL